MFLTLTLVIALTAIEWTQWHMGWKLRRLWSMGDVENWETFQEMSENWETFHFQRFAFSAGKARAWRTWTCKFWKCRGGDFLPFVCRKCRRSPKSHCVEEQLELAESGVSDVNEIRVNSIGAPVNISTLNLSTQLKAKVKLLAHYAAGWENFTLRDLWSFCRETETSPNQVVVYLHSKGSFHAHETNGMQRYCLTSGALSQECMHLPKQCNVCSTRMTPIPQPHTPGNMWTARCGYIAKLINPKDFREKMNGNELGPHNGRPWCVGRGRFADEHWVNSHPDVAPCDLDTNQSYVIGAVPTSIFDKNLKKTPRFPMSVYHVEWQGCPGRGESVEHRLMDNPPQVLVHAFGAKKASCSICLVHVLSQASAACY